MLENNQHGSCSVNLTAFISMNVNFPYSLFIQHQKNKNNKTKGKAEAYAKYFLSIIFAKEKKNYHCM